MAQPVFPSPPPVALLDGVFDPSRPPPPAIHAMACDEAKTCWKQHRQPWQLMATDGNFWFHWTQTSSWWLHLRVAQRASHQPLDGWIQLARTPLSADFWVSNTWPNFIFVCQHVAEELGMLSTENQHKPDVSSILWKCNLGGLKILKRWFCSGTIYDDYCPHARNWTRTCQKWVPGSLNKCMLRLSGKTSQIARLLEDNTTSMTVSWVAFIDQTGLHTTTSTYLCSSHRIDPNSSTLRTFWRASLMCLATCTVLKYLQMIASVNHSSGLASTTEATGRSLAQGFPEICHKSCATE